MSEVETYVLLKTVCRRIEDFLHDPEPQHDAMLEDLCKDLSTSRSKTVMRLHREIEKVLQDYEKIVQNRITDMEQFS